MSFPALPELHTPVIIVRLRAAVKRKREKLEFNPQTFYNGKKEKQPGFAFMGISSGAEKRTQEEEHEDESGVLAMSLAERAAGAAWNCSGFPQAHASPEPAARLALRVRSAPLRGGGLLPGLCSPGGSASLGSTGAGGLDAAAENRSPFYPGMVSRKGGSGGGLPARTAAAPSRKRGSGFGIHCPDQSPGRGAGRF